VVAVCVFVNTGVTGLLDGEAALPDEGEAVFSEGCEAVLSGGCEAVFPDEGAAV
jgi:hypothetical protein